MVALREEGVDRNRSRCAASSPPLVALREEGVDRNSKSWTKSITHCTSPSARRAWIEIGTTRKKYGRAWIEI